jgi:hypothetical protein
MARFARGLRRGVLLTLLVVVLSSAATTRMVLANVSHPSAISQIQPDDGVGDSPLVP